MSDRATPLPCRRSKSVARPFGESRSYLVRDRLRGESFQLGPEEQLRLARLDGTRSAENLRTAFAERFGKPLTPDVPSLGRRGKCSEFVPSRMFSRRLMMQPNPRNEERPAEGRRMYPGGSAASRSSSSRSGMLREVATAWPRTTRPHVSNNPRSRSVVNHAPCPAWGKPQERTPRGTR
jgi:hypothetical protein